MLTDEQFISYMSPINFVFFPGQEAGVLVPC